MLLAACNLLFLLDGALLLRLLRRPGTRADGPGRRLELRACAGIAGLAIFGFALAHVGMNASWTGQIAVTDAWWLVIGATFAAGLLASHGLLALQRSEASRILLPAAAFLTLLGLLNVYVSETRDDNAYITTAALPAMRAFEASAAPARARLLPPVPNEVDFERNPWNRARRRFATVLDDEWLAEYNRAVRVLQSRPGGRGLALHEVHRYGDLIKQLLFALLGLLALPGTVFAWSRRAILRRARDGVPLVSLSAALVLVTAVAVLTTGGRHLPAFLVVRGHGITVYDAVKLGAILVVALALTQLTGMDLRARRLARLALASVGLASLAMLMVDHGSGIALLAIVAFMAALELGPAWRSRIATPGAMLALVAPAAIFLGLHVPQSVSARLRMWADPWGSYAAAQVDHSTGRAVQQIASYRLGQPVDLSGSASGAPSRPPPSAASSSQPLVVLVRNDVAHVKQELWWRLAARRGLQNQWQPFIPGPDPGDRLALLEAENIWSSLGGYRSNQPLSALTSHIEHAIADLRAETHLFVAATVSSSPSGRLLTPAVVKSALDPFTGAPDDFQLQRALFALRAGGLFGVGIGSNRTEALPAASADVPFAAIGEAFGLAGVALVVGFILLIATRGIAWAQHARSRPSALLMAGLAASFGLQALMTIGGTSGLVPFSGLTFPFLASGGTAMIANFVAIGLLMAAAGETSPAPAARAFPDPWPLGRMRWRLGRDAGFPAAFAAVLASVGFLQLTGHTLIPGAILGGLPGGGGAALNAGDQWGLPNYRMVPGEIVDRNGVVLERTDAVGEPRTYPHPELAQSLGHTLQGLDLEYGDRLREATRGSVSSAKSPPVGSSLVTTIDANIQRALAAAYSGGAAEAGLPVSGLRGAAVVLDVKSGDILGLTSRPTFSLSELSDPWAWVTAEAGDRRQGLPFRHLNRVIGGQYPPGSIFKTITAAAILDHGLHAVHSRDFDYRKAIKPPDGLFHLGRWHELAVRGGPPISDGNHPQLPPKDWDLSLENAYAWSDNVAFAQMGLQLGPSRMVDMADRFGFEHRIAVPGLGSSYSSVDNDAGKPLDQRPVAQSPANLARTAFGQAQVRATPLQMALVAAGIADGGTIMQPQLLAGWRPPGNLLTDVSFPRTLFDTGLSKTAVAGMHDLMGAAVSYGWAGGARVNPRDEHPAVAGKTGSAEWSRPQDAAHSWFIGYFPAESPRIAFAVVVERGGFGPIVATRIARRIFGSPAVAAYLRKGSDR